MAQVKAKARTQTKASNKVAQKYPKWPFVHKLLNTAVGIPATVLADAAGISAATIYNLRNGKSFSPRATTMQKMGVALGLHMMWVTTNAMRTLSETEKKCLEAVTPERLSLNQEAKRRKSNRGQHSGARIISLRKERQKRLTA